MKNLVNTRWSRSVIAAAAIITSAALLAAGGGMAQAASNPERGNTVVADGNATVNSAYNPEKLNPSNPLREGKWATYLGPTDQLGAPYANATGEDKTLLGKIALAPRAVWFGQWLSADGITARTQRYIAAAQQGDPNAIVQISVFSMEPWESAACKQLPTPAQQQAYYDWTNKFAAGIGNSRVVLILQPDLMIARCLPHHSTLPLQMIARAAKQLSALPNATVYLDAGSSQWPSPGQGGVKNALKYLIPAGVKYVRGISLNATHYQSTTAEISRGTAIVRALGRRGITGKKVVINTSSNGHPFNFGDFQKEKIADPPVCSSLTQKGICVALGIPPTWNTSSSKWGLSAMSEYNAARYVDGYLWFGRPWLYKQASPFLLNRALDLAELYNY